jgi:hypothetical protein
MAQRSEAEKEWFSRTAEKEDMEGLFEFFQK